MSAPTAPTTETHVEATIVEPAEELGDNGAKALKAERARANAAEKSAKELKARLDQIEAGNLSELERAQRAAAETQQELAQARAEALRYRVAAKHQITDEDAEVFLTGSDEETLTRQATRLAELAAARTTDVQPGPRPDRSQGASSAPLALNGDPLEQALREKLGIA